jgi:hypothetical protein
MNDKVVKKTRAKKTAEDQPPLREAVSIPEPETDLLDSVLLEVQQKSKRVSLKKTSKKVIEKLYVEFDDPYDQDTDDPNDAEHWETSKIYGRRSSNLRGNIEKILLEKTDLEIKEYSKKSPSGKIVFELRKKETSTTPLETEVVKKIVYEHLPHYTEVSERYQRMRSCKIKELDGKFYLFVIGNRTDFGYADTDEIIEMAFSEGKYEVIDFS